MDAMSQDLLPELECPVCNKYMMPPITMCESGHNICNRCRPALDKCPTCGERILDIRNKTIENLARKVRYPCTYSEFGCKEAFLLDLMDQHEEQCHFRPQKCPFDITEIECSWEGPVEGIATHIRETHTFPRETFEANGQYKNQLPEMEPNNIWCQAVFSMNEVFFHINKTTENTLYSCVQYVGYKSNAGKFKYKFTFSTADGSEYFTACHVTPSYLDDVEETFETGKCMVLPYDFVRRFFNVSNFLIFETEILRASTEPPVTKTSE